MKSDQGTIIVMIVFILLSVLLMVLCWVFYSQSKDTYLLLEAAKGEATKLEGSLRAANSDVDKLKEIIGAATAVPIADIGEKFTNQAKEKAMPDTAKGYMGLVDFLYSKLKGVSKELEDAKNTNLALQTKFETLYKDTQEQIRIHEDAAVAAQKKLQEEQAKYAQSMAGRDKIKQDLLKDNQTIRADAEAAIKQIQTEKAIAENNLKNINTVNEGLTKAISELRAPVLEQEDGRIVTVNQLNGIVTLNIGSASGLRNGITFAVFDPNEKNLAEAKPKGSIEVSQVLGPNNAEARILETVITEPIMRGDLIYTPVWKPGLHQRFVLSGQMVVPGFGSKKEDNTTFEDDVRNVINLILANGGIVDYYMRNDGVIMKVNTRIDAQGKIQFLGEETANFSPGGGGDELLQETAFLVVGKGDALNDTLMSNMRVLDERAKVQGIRTITLSELLRRMGWRNAVPTQGYGRLANESDLAARPTKPMPVSPGVVSPIYSQQATTPQKSSPGNVSPLYLDSSVMKSSPGTVSPLYQKDRKPVNAAPGVVSGIYGGQ
ncbi:MAG: hypothetical protein FWC43_05500 [Planctomycetaceae bacterium]|nr:hypothetical protein [Planctomycetaceae bacterium]